MNEEQWRRLVERIVGFVRVARSGVVTLETEINRIMSDTARLTPEARRSDVATALAEGTTRILAILREEARTSLNNWIAVQDDALVKLTAVAPDQLEARSRVLQPVLNGALERPHVLINAYRQRHNLPADRKLLEETASAVIDGLGDLDNYEFRDSWRALQQEIAVSRGPEEAKARDYRAALDDMGTYLDNAEILVGADLTLLDPSITGDRRGEILTQRAMVEARVNEWEANNAGEFSAPVVMMS